jgi:hypothetical protein
MEKEMYLKVIVKEKGDVHEIILPKSYDIKRTDVISIENAEMAGARKLHQALDCIVHIKETNKDWVDIIKRHFNGYFLIIDILNYFTSKDIIDRVEKMNSRIPRQGDVYVSRLSGANIVVLDYRYDEILGEYTIRFIGKGYISNMEEKDFYDKFQFLDKNINISELVNITKN